MRILCIIILLNYDDEVVCLGNAPYLHAVDNYVIRVLVCVSVIRLVTSMKGRTHRYLAVLEG